MSKRLIGDESAAFSKWRPRPVESDGWVGSKAISTASMRERWRSVVRDKLAALTTLEENWDTYGGSAIKAQTAIFAAQVLDDIWISGLPIPAVMPTSAQSVYIEWNTASFDFSIEVKAPYAGSYSYEDRGAAMQEGEFRDNLIELEKIARAAVGHLAPRAVA